VSTEIPVFGDVTLLLLLIVPVFQTVV